MPNNRDQGLAPADWWVSGASSSGSIVFGFPSSSGFAPASESGAVPRSERTVELAAEPLDPARQPHNAAQAQTTRNNRAAVLFPESDFIDTPVGFFGAFVGVQSDISARSTSAWPIADETGKLAVELRAGVISRTDRRGKRAFLRARIVGSWSNKKPERVYKPGSVESDHFSGTAVTCRLKRSTRE